MKKLDRFILTSFVGPFAMILLVVIFILMMQFLWLYIDELVGKGLGFKIIMEFMFWGSCTVLPTALPLATLLASMMTMGQMGENNELIALKSAGISVLRIMTPIMIASVVISIATFFVLNNLVPVSYNEIYTLRDDIGRTKNEIKIPSGTFYDGIDGYVLRVKSRDDKTGMMYGVMVYDHSGNKGNTSLTLADSAVMRMSKQKDFLTFILYDGLNYQETNSKNGPDPTRQMQKTAFSRQELIIPLSNYNFQKSEGNKFGNQVRAMKLDQLSAEIDSLNTKLDSVSRSKYPLIASAPFTYKKQLDTASFYKSGISQDFQDEKLLVWDNDRQESDAYGNAARKAEALENSISSLDRDAYQYTYILRRADVEYYKKFAQALACLVLFFVGAPLGALIRKGGLGTSAIVSVLFFVLYWVIDITGSKLAKDGAASAVAGSFISPVVLLAIGFFLTWKAIHDSDIFNTDSLSSWWRKAKSRFLAIFGKTRIVFMGTPEFAVASLDALFSRNYKVVGVVTVPDKPVGRGLKIAESPVKKYASEHGIPVLQPEKLKDPEFLDALSALKADLFVVVGFRMLPEVVWTMPSMGTFNLHAALLPQYRGAAPINWAVINGERMTGVTTFMIDKNIDTGGIMLRQESRINPEDTVGDVHDRLMAIGAELVVQTVEGLIQHNIETRVQRSFIQGAEILHPAPKLSRELCHIDWNDSTFQVYNLIRGLSPYPAAFTTLIPAEADSDTAANGPVQLKVFFGERVEGDDFGKMKERLGLDDVKPGSIMSDGKSFMAVATADGAISLTDVQLAGKKRMDIKAFLAGFRNLASYTTGEGTSRAEIEKTR